VVALGYIDQKGAWAIPPQFENAGSFSEGFAAVVKEGRYGFVNSSGELVIPCRFYAAEEFSQGLASVVLDSKGTGGERAGYVSLQGDWAIPPKYVETLPFRENLAAVKVRTQAPGGVTRTMNDLWGFIDRTGTLVIKPAFSGVVLGFSDGLACVEQAGAWGYIDPTGQFKIAPRFREAKAFSDGLGAFKIDGRWGFVDRIGTFVIPARYQDCSPFSEALAAVKVRGRWGFIDKTGRTAIEPKFLTAEGFSNRLAKVEEDDGRWAYIDRQGDVVWRQQNLGSNQRCAKERVIQGEEVGLAQSTLIKKYGVPSGTTEFRANEMGDEMRYGLRFELPASQAGAHVKELQYSYDNGDCKFFWLVQDEKGEWIVFSSAFVPQGMAI
jgi:hypothetical protein